MNIPATLKAARHAVRVVGWLTFSITLVVVWLFYMDDIHARFPHAYTVEVVQLVAAFHAQAFSLWCVWDAWKDRSALRAAKQNGPRRGLADGNVWSEVGKSCVLAIFIYIGFNAVRFPPPDDVRLTDTFHGAAEQFAIVTNRVGIMVATFIMLLDSIRERRARMTYVRSMRGVPRELLAPPPGRGGSDDYPQPPDRRHD